MVIKSSPTILSALVLLALLTSVFCFKAVRTFRFRNSASQTIWIGAFGVPLMPQTGWEMAPNT